eukprot:COSAG01_NODE_2910_length_6877_cov_3.042785_5_plen_61_part_00
MTLVSLISWLVAWRLEAAAGGRRAAAAGGLPAASACLLGLLACWGGRWARAAACDPLEPG